MGNAPSIDTSQFVQKSELNNFVRSSELNNFVTDSELLLTTKDFVTETDLKKQTEGYMTAAGVDARLSNVTRGPQGERGPAGADGKNADVQKEVKPFTLWCATGETCELPLGKKIPFSGLTGVPARPSLSDVSGGFMSTGGAVDANRRLFLHDGLRFVGGNVEGDMNLANSINVSGNIHKPNVFNAQNDKVDIVRPAHLWNGAHMGDWRINVDNENRLQFSFKGNRVAVIGQNGDFWSVEHDWMSRRWRNGSSGLEFNRDGQTWSLYPHNDGSGNHFIVKNNNSDTEYSFTRRPGGNTRLWVNWQRM